MAEAAGLAVGVVALAGLFSTCIECFDYIDSARAYEQDSEILIGKILIQRLRLSVWGNVMGLTGDTTIHITGNFERNSTREAVRVCLNQTRKILADVEEIVNKHAFAIAEQNVVPGRPRLEYLTRTSKLKRCLGIFGTSNSISEGPSLKKRATWAIRDKARLTTLVEDLKDFIDGLHGVIPALQPRYNRLVQRAICSVSDTEALELVSAATVEDYPDWSDTASVALSRDARPSLAQHRVNQWALTVSRSEYNLHEAQNDPEHNEVQLEIDERHRPKNMTKLLEALYEAHSAGGLDQYTSTLEDSWILASDDKCNTILHFMASKDGPILEDLPKAIILHGANIEARNKEGATPLIVASSSDNDSMVRILISSGAAVDACDHTGRTALSYASCFNLGKEKYWYKRSFYILLESGADLNIMDSSGMTALHHAIIAGKSRGAIETLCEMADIDIKTNDGSSVLDLMAKVGGFDDIAVSLVKQGLRIERPPGLGSNDITESVEKNEPQYTRYLLWRSTAAEGIEGLEERVCSPQNLDDALMIGIRCGHDMAVESLSEKWPELKDSPEVSFGSDECLSRALFLSVETGNLWFAERVLGSCDQYVVEDRLRTILQRKSPTNRSLLEYAVQLRRMRVARMIAAITEVELQRFVD